MPNPIYVGQGQNPFGIQAANFLFQLSLDRIQHKQKMEEARAIARLQAAQKGRELEFQSAMAGSDFYRSGAAQPPAGYVQNPYDTTSFISRPQPKIANQVDLGDRVRLFYSDGRTEVIQKGEAPGKNKEKTFENERDLRKEFQALPEVKSYSELRQQIGRADEAIKLAREGKISMNSVDQSLITILNKMLDPNSVVRESEYARTPEGSSVINRLQGYKQRLMEGGAGISPAERESIYKMTQQLYSVSRFLYDKQSQYYSRLAQSYGLNPERVIRLGMTEGETGYTAPAQPSAPLAPPKVGAIRKGYAFQGGDPSNPANWLKVRK